MLLALLVLSGLGLTLFYSPTAERAASSLASLHRDQPLGWLLHNTHRWSALLLLTFVVLHALRVWLSRAWDSRSFEPREAVSPAEAISVVDLAKMPGEIVQLSLWNE